MLAASCAIDDSIFVPHNINTASRLSKAALSGDLETISKLISQGCLPQTPDNTGWTCIHSCVSANQIEALKLILKLKPNNKEYLVNLKTWENVTPLLVAMKAPKPSVEMVELLLKSGANPRQCTHTKISPLHLACMGKYSLECIKLLVQYKANVNAQEDITLFTPLHFAVCKSQDLEIIKYLINISNLNKKDLYNRTAFLEACNADFLEAVKLFLDKDKSLANPKSGMPPLMFAAFLGNLEMTKVLLAAGANPNRKCKAVVSYRCSELDMTFFETDSFQPIHSSLKNIEIFKLLLKVTDSKKLLEMETDYYSFSLFVMVYGRKDFFECLLQSEFPNSLKSFSSDVLVKFVFNYPEVRKVLEIFIDIFKYYLNHTPESVFHSFALQITKDTVVRSLDFLHLLAQMGISGSRYQSRKMIFKAINDLIREESYLGDLFLLRSTCRLLKEPILTLKQLSRIVVRQTVRAHARSDWEAYCMVKKMFLPDSLKQYILFESFIPM